MIPRIDEMTEPPIAGRFYMVPTIEHNWFGLSGIWPLIGPKHDDREIIGYPYLHYHVDGRFLTKQQRAFASAFYLGFEGAIAARPLVTSCVENRPPPFAPIRYRRRRCSASRVRYMTETLPYSSANIPKWHRDLATAFAGKCLVRGEHGWICPHRGAHLGSIRPDAEGNIICPLHGLRWNATTGAAAPEPLDDRILSTKEPTA